MIASGKKRLTALFILTVFGITSWAAGLDRSKAPKPGPAPKIQLGKYEKFELENGLKVIVVQNQKLPTISFSILVDWDPILEKDKAGYVGMAGEMLRRGTTNRTKDEIDIAVDFIGATLFTTPSRIQGSSLSKHGEKLFEIMADIVKNAEFKQEEFDKVLKETLSNIKSTVDSPDQIMANLRNSVLYGADHPYGEISTEKTINNITTADLKTFYKENFIPNNCYLAMVGDITPQQAKALAKKYLGDWKRGQKIERKFEQPTLPEKTHVSIVDKAGAVQTVLHLANTMDLKPGAPDAIKARVTNILLGGPQFRLFKNLREDKGYTYGAYAAFDPDKIIGEFRAYAEVRNEVTEPALKEFLHELNRIRTEDVTEEELEVARNFAAGVFALGLENSNTIAQYVINTDLYDLPSDYYENYLQGVASTTVADVKDIANKYIHPDKMGIFAVGNAEELEKALASYGDVKRYDGFGSPIDTSALTLPDGLTADAVIAKYLEAIGGLEAINAVKDFDIRGSMGVMGMNLDFARKYKAPNMAFTSATMNGQTMFKQVFNGEKGVTSQMGNSAPIQGEELEAIKLESHFIPERFYKEWKVDYKLSGAEMIHDRLAYRMTIVLPNGSEKTTYYDAESGLKVKTVSTNPAGTQSTEFTDYRDIKGVKFPFKTATKAGPQNLEFTTKTLEVNSGLSNDDFKVE